MGVLIESNIYVPGWDGPVPILTGDDFEDACMLAYPILPTQYPAGPEGDASYGAYKIYCKEGVGLFAGKYYGTGKKKMRKKRARSLKEKNTIQLNLWEAA